MDTKILILAAGRGRGWDDERCRHLLPIRGEPLVLRTRRLCAELGHLATIVTDEPRIQEAVRRYFAPGPNKWIYDTMRNTRELWADRTIFLPGDVLYHRGFIGKVLAAEGNCLWAGNYGILAVVFDREPWETVSDWLARAWAEAERRGHGELQILAGPRIRTVIDRREDLMDFDTIAYYEKCLRDFPWTATKLDFEKLDELARRSREPLPDAWLEDLQAKVHGPDAKRPLCRFLYWLSLETQPPLALEIGVEWGVTSAHLCAAAAEFGGHVVGVDVRTHERPAKLLPERFGNYTFLHMDALDALPEVAQVAARHGDLALVLQDGSHLYETSREEWDGYSALFGEETVWVANLMPPRPDREGKRPPVDVADFWRELPARKKVYANLYPGAEVGVAFAGGGPTRILILAGGRKHYDGWHGDCLRQMAPVAGEPLLLRTLRELEERGHAATVVTDEPQIKEAVPDHFHSDEETIWGAILGTKTLWEGDVLVLLGDVFYRREHWEVIFGYEGETPACFDGLACLFGEKDYDRAVAALGSLRQKGEPFFNLLWREGHFLKVETVAHVDFDIVPYYDKFLEDNPWARPPVLVVLAAGDADRLSAVFDGPKALLEFGGRTLLERILDAFAEIGVAEAVVVAGYRADEVRERVGDRRGGMSVDYVVKADFADTLTGDGLLAARDRWLDRACFVVSGDHLFHPGLVTDVCRRMPPDSILVDPSAPLDGEETVLVRAGGEIFLVWPGSTAVGEVLAESPEIFRFSPEGTRVVVDYLAGADVYEAANRLEFTVHDTSGYPWIEIDTPEDLERARTMFKGMV